MGDGGGWGWGGGGGGGMLEGFVPSLWEGGVRKIDGLVTRLRSPPLDPNPGRGATPRRQRPTWNANTAVLLLGLERDWMLVPGRELQICPPGNPEAWHWAMADAYWPLPSATAPTDAEKPDLRFLG